MMNQAGSAAVRGEYRSIYEQHLKHQRCQRGKFYKHVQKGIERPDLYLSIIIDAMDQQKTQLPHAARFSKKTKDGVFLKQKLVGAMVHGMGTWLYVSSPPVATGSNLTIHALLKTLVEVGNRRVASGMDRYPPTLYLQLDNANDNKSFALLALCDLLVTAGLFRKIKVSFLLVGHTHEDIDQYFR
jgi:hypothetical protein